MSYDGSMSVNAREAYAADRKPVSRITKQDILKYGVDVSIEFFRWYVKRYYQSNEWHHTSAKLNETTFYDIEACCSQFKKADIEKLKSQYSERPKKKPDPRINDEPYYAKIEYSISTFKGSRKYFDAYAVVCGRWAYYFDEYHKGIRKKDITGRHFAIAEKYQSRPDELSEEKDHTIWEKINEK